jgi:competence ComEA-like helix-hairpin-helix protein
MSMTTFASTSTLPPAAPPDPAKHVNYTVGMVLGVDDFTQEFAYLSGRDQWLARDLLGYGTVCGLAIGKENGSNGPQVTVSAGVALSPRGQLIHVTPAQCASLNDWLSAHKEEVVDAFGSPPDSPVRLYVVLRYRECPTDDRPIPGEPCRTEEEATAPSRIMDDFKLELRLKAPDQQEEDALREFVAWLGQIETTAVEGEATPLNEFVEAVRGSLVMPDSPPASPPVPLFGSPPSDLKIAATEACEYFRSAFRVWVTELRPLVRHCWLSLNAPCSEPDANVESELYGELLLAELSVGITSEMVVQDMSSIEIDEEHRPFLIHLRLLQEMLLCGRSGIGGGTGLPGERGPTGAKGPSGDKGPTGDKGPDGFKGPTGDKGATGDKGPTGDKGATGDKGPTGNKGPDGDPGAGLETDLTRIVALSWTHNASSMMEFELDGKPVKGLVVGFGKWNLGDSGRVLVGNGSLDDNSFQVFTERRHREGNYDWYDYVRIGPLSILGVKPEVDSNGIIVKAATVGGLASGAAFLFSSDAFKTVWGQKLVIVIRGDLIRDESEKRAIDAEFLRAELPTGDRPHGAKAGIQGGRFESWVTVEMKLNLNTATLEEITTLPRIGPAIAARIVAARKSAGGFNSVDDLLNVAGIGQDLLNQIKPFITVS